MRHFSDEDRAKRKSQRKHRRRRTLASIKYTIAKLVGVADHLFPDSGTGKDRLAWVLKQAASLIRTPQGKPLPVDVTNYLIELAVDEL